MGGVLANILGGNALTGVAKVIDSIRGKSPEDAAKLAQIAADTENLRAKYASDFEIAKINENEQLNATAAENIQTEAKANWYTSAARPSVIWVGLFVIVWDYVVVPLVAVKYPALKVATLPDWFWSCWKAISLGYVINRTIDKVADNVFGGSGGSVQLPFGMKINSKGD